MGYSEEVKEYAKSLFLRAGADGGHLYSFQEIRDLVCQKFDTVKSLKRQTIQQWSTSKNKVTGKSWADLWDRGQRSGVVKAQEQIEDDYLAEEQLAINIDYITRLRAGNARKVSERIQKKLDNGDEISLDDARAWKVAEIVFKNLNLENVDESPVSIIVKTPQEELEELEADLDLEVDGPVGSDGDLRESDESDT